MVYSGGVKGQVRELLQGWSDADGPREEAGRCLTPAAFFAPSAYFLLRGKGGLEGFRDLLYATEAQLLQP